MVMRRIIVAAALCAGIVSQTGVAEELPRVSEIVFEGAERTQDRILRRALRLQPGDRLDAAVLEGARQDLLDLELFRSVEARTEPDGPGRVRVVLSVDEKRYWIVLPRIGRNSQGDVSVGISSRFNNLFGLNHTFTARVGQKDHNASDRGTEEQVILRYDIPGLGDSRYDLNLAAHASHLDKLEQDGSGATIGTFEERNRGFSVGVGRWMGDLPIGRGLRLGLGLEFRERRNALESGSLDRPDALRQVGLSFSARERDFRHHVWSDSGVAYGYRLEQGIGGLSDQTYTSQELWYKRLWSLSEDDHRNLYVDMGLGRFRDGHRSFVTFGPGRPDLRNVLDEVEEGDTYQFLRVGYLHPAFGRDSLRAELFMDAGEEYFSGRGHQDASNVAFGVGLRWRIRSWVKFELAFALAYSPDSGERKLVIGTEGLD